MFSFSMTIADDNKSVSVGDYLEFQLKVAGKGPRAYELKKLDSIN
jgi:hypothetical protein